MQTIQIQTSGPLSGSIRPPGSKSLTNRALVCAALADGSSILTGVLDSEDTRVMADCLSRLGVQMRWLNDRKAIQVEGCHGQLRTGPVDLEVQNSGTTMRFLTAIVCLGHGRYTLDGNARMRQRPIGDLLQALQCLGVPASTPLADGFPPVVIEADGLPGGGIDISGSTSSQYASGLMLAAPCATSPLTITLTGNLVSTPYVAMTARVMDAFGVKVQLSGDATYQVPQCSYRACAFNIEPDASAASYFWGAAAITGGEVEVLGLQRDSMQGDVEFCTMLEEMGCKVTESSEGLCVLGQSLRGIDTRMTHISDTVPTLAVVALFAQGPTTIRGVEHIRHKESDRIADLAREIRKLGAGVDEHHDGLTIHPASLRGATLDTYDDHRMAMSLALAGLRVPGIIIRDPSCVGKTYPNFFADLETLRSMRRNGPWTHEV